MSRASSMLQLSSPSQKDSKCNLLNSEGSDFHSALLDEWKLGTNEHKHFLGIRSLSDSTKAVYHHTFWNKTVKHFLASQCPQFLTSQTPQFITLDLSLLNLVAEDEKAQLPDFTKLSNKLQEIKGQLTKILGIDTEH
eukprot:Filipodium_phascolosomae@DN2404_c1_g1_i1.p1